VKATEFPEIGFPFASATVAVAVDVEVPFAVIDGGVSTTVTCDAGPAEVGVASAVPASAAIAIAIAINSSATRAHSPTLSVLAPRRATLNKRIPL
jgi:hypothetical protein